MSKSSHRTAVNLLRSWLIAASAQVDDGRAGGDLSVNGRPVYVVDPEGPTPPPGAVSISGLDLTGRSPSKRAAAFHVVTEAVGLGRPEPPERRPQVSPDTGLAVKADYHDDEFLVVVRHAEFRRSPDPTPEQLAAFRPIAKRASRHFRRCNPDFCRVACLEQEDLNQYADCWLVNFAALHARRQSPDEDARLFVSYLQQRFAELYATFTKKVRSCAPDADTFSVAMFDRPFHRKDGNFFRASAGTYGPARPSDQDGGYFVDPRDVEEPDDSEEDEEDEEGVRRRRHEAGSALDGMLAQIGPEAALEATERVAFSPLYDPEARDEARRRWRRLFVELPPQDAEARLVTIVKNDHYDLALKKMALRLLEDLRQPKPEPRDSRLLPQANVLSLVRDVVAAVKAGRVDSFDLSEACGCGVRDSQYYRHAARVLGLLDGDRVTEMGRLLLDTEKESAGETAAFREAVDASSFMRTFSWFFDDRRRGVEELVAFLVREFGISESTARRRASSLKCWRLRLAA